MNNLSLFLSTTLIWGTVWIAVKFQLNGADELVSILYRMVLSSLFLVIVCITIRQHMKLTLRHHILTALMGVFLFSSNYWFFYLATSRIESGLVSVIFSTIAVFNAVNGRIFLNVDICFKTFLGGAIGILGIALLFNQDFSNTSISNQRLEGITLALIATLLVSFGNTLSAKLSMDNIPVIKSTTTGMIYGCIVTLIAAVLSDANFATPLTVSYVTSLIYLSVVCTAIAFLLYLSLIKQIGVGKAAFANLLFPVIALLISTLFEGYSWNYLSLLGALIVLAGVAIPLLPLKVMNRNSSNTHSDSP